MKTVSKIVVFHRDVPGEMVSWNGTIKHCLRVNPLLIREVILVKKKELLKSCNQLRYKFQVISPVDAIQFTYLNQ